MLRVVHIWANSFVLFSGHSYMSGTGPLRLSSLSHSSRSQHRQKVTKPLCQAYLMSLFSAWSLNTDLPPFWKTHIYWCAMNARFRMLMVVYRHCLFTFYVVCLLLSLLIVDANTRVGYKVVATPL